MCQSLVFVGAEGDIATEGKVVDGRGGRFRGDTRN